MELGEGLQSVVREDIPREGTFKLTVKEKRKDGGKTTQTWELCMRSPEEEGFGKFKN